MLEGADPIDELEKDVQSAGFANVRQASEAVDFLGAPPKLPSHPI